MAIVARKLKDGKSIVYYIKLDYQGRAVWRRAGGDERAAERLEARMRKEMRAGNYHGTEGATGAKTIGAYAKAWLSGRTIRWAPEEESYLRRYVLSRRWFAQTRMDDVRQKDVLKLIGELRETVSEQTSEKLSEKTVTNIFGSLRTMFRSAVAREVILRDPCILDRNTFDRSLVKKRAPYTKANLRALIVSDKVHPTARMFATIAFFTGMRQGEICGRRWRDIDPSVQPLGCLTVESQYGDRPLKTGKRVGHRLRLVPIHPALARALERWRTDGFELVHRRKPVADDFIVPASDGTAHTKSSSYKMWVKACKRADVENISLHSARHTFVTLCRRGGARDEVIERITHNAAGRMIDRYTHWDWAPLCEAVLCLGVEPRVDSARELAELTVEALGIETGLPPGTPQLSRESSGNTNTGENAEEPPSTVGRAAEVADVDAAQQPRTSAHMRRPAPWVAEATANLLALMAGVE